MSPNWNLTFWQRNGMPDECHDECLRAIQARYLYHSIKEFKDQGYCSFTVLATPNTTFQEENQTDATCRASKLPSGTGSRKSTLENTYRSLIIQLRPPQHSPNTLILSAAKKTYGDFAPSIKEMYLDYEIPIQLQAFESEMIVGTPYSRLQPRMKFLYHEENERQRKFVRTLARFVAMSWPYSKKGRERAPSLSICLPAPEKLVPKILLKIQKLSQELPDGELRSYATSVLSRISDLERLPAVLNHGDLIPTNILISEDTWNIAGVVDWAEAEYLPFATCLYGLEYFLGYFNKTTSSAYRPKFQYYAQAPELRNLFYSELQRLIPDIKNLLYEVRLARDVGVFLWFGYAWDEGKIDRVVNENNDVEEVILLRTFLHLEAYGGV